MLYIQYDAADTISMPQIQRKEKMHCPDGINRHVIPTTRPDAGTMLSGHSPVVLGAEKCAARRNPALLPGVHLLKWIATPPRLVYCPYL
jgi:hypothetical protein